MSLISHHMPEDFPQDNHQGEERHIGVEIEMTGLTSHQIAELVQQRFGGEIECSTIFDYRVVDTCFGEVKIELDAEYLKDLAKVLGITEQQGGKGAIMDFVEETSREALTKAAETLVPWEIVSPPLPLSKLEEFDGVIPSLRQAGAMGTRDSMRYAFGMHLNPELPALDAHTILRYLKAYFCLFDWIRKQEDIDFARRLTPYIDHFKSAYVEKVLAPGYQPKLDELIRDYLEHNPTRNRSLDMLPLFAHLNRELVEAHVQDSRIKARPTFHYRLPNCDIDNPDWNVMRSWQRWCKVERLAYSEDLQSVCDAYLEEKSSFLPDLSGHWAERIDDMIRKAA